MCGCCWRRTWRGPSKASHTPFRSAGISYRGALQPSGTNSSNTQHKNRSADGCVVPQGDPSGNLSKSTRTGLWEVEFCSPRVSESPGRKDALATWAAPSSSTPRRYPARNRFYAAGTDRGRDQPGVATRAPLADLVQRQSELPVCNDSKLD
jgi:hypothetical protein